MRIAICALAIVVLPSIAEAETPKKLAAKHRKAGNTAYEVSDYAKAIDEYKLAYELSPDPRLFYNLGLSHLKQYEIGRQNEDLVQARDYFDRFLGLMSVEKAKPKEKKKIAQLRKLAKDHLDKLSTLARAQAEPPPVQTATIAIAPPPPPPPIEVRLPPPPPPEPEPFPTWAVLFGAAGATAVAAIVTGALAISGSNEAYDAALAGDLSAANSRGDRAMRFAYATDGLLAGTVVIAGVGLWLLLD